MFTFFGYLLIVLVILNFIRKKFFPNFPVKVNLPNYASATLIVLGILLTAVFYARPGHSYKVYYPFGGGSKVVSKPGFNFDWWGQRREFQNEIAFKYVIPIDTLGTMPDDIPSNIYFFSAADHQWEFADAVKAHIGVSVIISLNTDNHANFSKMVDDAKFENQLVYGRIIPDINTAIKNTCKLMYAQEYISGEAANFDRYFKDQLENGSYQLEQYFVQGEDDIIIGDTLNKSKVSGDGSNKKGGRRWRIKEDPKTGLPLRDGEKTSLALYHMTIRQAVSDNIDWEDRFDDRLDKQKEQVALTQLEKQMAEKATYNQKRLFAEGEAKKTEEKARLEKEQIQQTINAQTLSQVASYKIIEENNLLLAAAKSSERIRVQADAQAYANGRLVQGGLTPQEKAKFENERAIGVAAEQAKTKYPEFLIINGDKTGGDGILSNLIGANMAKEMIKKKE